MTPSQVRVAVKQHVKHLTGENAYPNLAITNMSNTALLSLLPNSGNTKNR